jgi:hypothetical protein
MVNNCFYRVWCDCSWLLWGYVAISHLKYSGNWVICFCRWTGDAIPVAFMRYDHHMSINTSEFTPEVNPLFKPFWYEIFCLTSWIIGTQSGASCGPSKMASKAWFYQNSLYSGPVFPTISKDCSSYLQNLRAGSLLWWKICIPVGSDWERCIFYNYASRMLITQFLHPKNIEPDVG